MFLGDRKEDIEATNDQFEAKGKLEQVFELADKVLLCNGMCCHICIQTLPIHLCLDIKLSQVRHM